MSQQTAPRPLPEIAKWTQQLTEIAAQPLTCCEAFPEIARHHKGMKTPRRTAGDGSWDRDGGIRGGDSRAAVTCPLSAPIRPARGVGRRRSAYS